MAKKTTPPPGGGQRVSNAEKQRRLDHAERLLRDGRSRSEVVQSMAAAFGCSVRSADEYMRRARVRLADEGRGTREVDREAALARLAHLSDKAEKRGAFAAAVSAEKLRAQIGGWLAPVEVKTTIEPPSPEPDMSIDDALAELEGLDAILRHARYHRDRGARADAEAPTSV